MIWEQAASPPFEADQFRATVHNRTFNRICQVALINMCAHITHICCRSGTEMLYQGSQRLNVCRLTQVEHRKDGTALAGPVLVMVRLCWGALDHHCGLELKPSRRATMSVFLHGVTLMSDLSLDKHVATVCAKCFYLLRQLRNVRRSPDTESAATFVHAFVTSRRVDYCNTILASESQMCITDTDKFLQAL